ncbi:MAG: MBL fold metallo-hydrolase [Alphaproteobacteria bacterium]|nr:MBL fold metallo-hydrolase [Alphaproteobacteria bacterium]
MLEIERYGPVEALHMGKPLLVVGRPMMTVRCYAVDGLLVDSGLHHHRRAVLDFARAWGAGRVALTHHHQDHSNNAENLRVEGLEVLASPQTRAILTEGFRTHFYDRWVWGDARRTRAAPLGPVIETERHRFEVLPAPGHCVDQVVFYERREGWLFSGDAFLATRIKYFRRDEDFAATVETTRRLAALEVSALFCAHRPRIDGAASAMRQKLDFLVTLEQRVRHLHASGWPDTAIARELIGADPLWLRLMTLGDASAVNVVRSILHGPTPRRPR